MKSTGKKLLSLLLAALLCFSLLPFSVLAEGEEDAALDADVNPAEEQILDDALPDAPAPEEPEEIPGPDEEEPPAQSTEPDEEETPAAEEEEEVTGEEEDAELSLLSELSSGSCGLNLTYTVDSDYALTISGTGDMEDYNSANVHPGWYSDAKNITSVTVDSGVTSIGNFAFFHLEKVTAIILPDSVTRIGDSAFRACTALQSVCFGSGLAQIGPSIFQSCSSLASIEIDGNTDYSSAGNCIVRNATHELLFACRNTVIPAGVTEIASYSFLGVGGITEIAIPEGVTTIGYNAFSNCQDLKTVWLPVSLTSISDSAFFNCEDIDDVYYAGTPDQWNALCASNVGTENDNLLGASIHCKMEGTTADGLSWSIDNYGVLRISGTGAMQDYDEQEIDLGEGNVYYTTDAPWGIYYEDVTSAVVESGVTCIGVSAFQGMCNIKSVSLPEGILSIGDDAFWECAALTELNIPGSIQSVGESAFSFCSALSTAVYPGTKTVWQNSVSVGTGNTCLTDALFFRIAYGTCGENVNWMISDDYVLKVYGSGWMKNYRYDDETDDVVSEISLPPWGEDYNDLIKEVLISPGVRNIGDYAFYNFSALESVTLDSGVQEIGKYAFKDCTALVSVTLGSGLQYIGERAFYGCSALKSITIPDNVQTIGWSAFGDCSSLESVTFGSGLQSIKPFAFLECASLKSISIPDSVTEFGKGVFSYCTALESVTFGSGLQTISENAFYYCSGLKRIDIPGNVTEICNYAFSSCDSLTEVHLGAGVQTIGVQAFYSENLQKVYLPNTVTVIDENGISSFLAPIYVYYQGTKTEWDAIDISSTNSTLKNAEIYYLADGGECEDGLRWSYYADADGNNATILIGGTGDMNSYETKDYSGVTASGAPWGKYYGSVKSLIIESGVHSLSSYAFYGFSALRSISFAEGLALIQSYAFSGCASLAELYLPDSLSTINTAAFQNDSGLTSVSFGDGLLNINAYAFDGCSSLITAEFRGSAEAWDAVTVYDHNEPLTALEVKCLLGKGSCGANLTWVLSGDGILTISGSGMMDDFTQGTAPWYALRESIVYLELGYYVRDIGEYAFEDCTQLIEINAEDFDEIRDSAFAGCTSLNIIYSKLTSYSWNNVHILDNNECFTGAQRRELYGSGIGGENIWWKEYSIPDENHHNIMYLEFFGSGDMKNWTYESRLPINSEHSDHVIINSGITSIGDYAFYGLDQICSVSIPDSVTRIGMYAFYDCYMLESVAIPENVTEIGEYAFQNCYSLKTIIVPGKVKNIEKGTFEYCYDLENFTIGSGVETIGEYAFHACTDLKELVLPDSVKNIGDYAFSNCSALSSINLGSGLESIGEYAFVYCYALKSIYLPASVKSVKMYAFYDCSGLRNVEIACCGDPFDNSAFYHCENLKNVIIYEGLTKLPEVMFNNVEALESITIPMSITEIGANFITDANVKDIYYAGARADWDAISKGDCSSIKYAALHCLIARGDCGADLTWVITEDGMLKITGSGAMSDYAEGFAPWFAYKDEINKAELDGSITYIGSNAFYEVNGLTEVIFNGTEAQWANLESTAGTGNETLFRAYRKPAAATITLDREYIALKSGETVQLSAEILPEYWLNNALLIWTTDMPSTAEVDEYGLVTAKAPGTACIRATITVDGYEYSAVCRVDVAGDEISESILGVGLNKTKITSTFFSTTYPEIKVLLMLEQNLSTLSLGGAAAQKDSGVAIYSAAFTDEKTAFVYRIRVCDDRTIQIIPTEDALDSYAENPKSILSKYVSPIEITLKNSDGTFSTFTTDKVTITVNKKLPTIKAKAITLNTYYAGSSPVTAPIEFTGAKVTGVSVGNTIVWWASLNGQDEVILNYVPDVTSGKMVLSVTAEGWNYRFPVTLSLKLKRMVPTLSLKASGFIETNVDNSAAVITATMKNPIKGRQIYTWEITDRYGADKLADFQVSEKDGKFTIKQGSPTLAAGSYTLKVLADQDNDGIYEVTKTVKFTVKTTAPAKLKQSVTMKAAGYIDLIRADSTIMLTLSFKNYLLYTPNTADLSFQKLSGKIWNDVPASEVPFEISTTGTGFILKAKPGAALSTADKYRVLFTDGITGLASKQISLSIKLGKGTVKTAQSEFTLFKKDCYSSVPVTLVPGDHLNRISQVTINGKDAALLNLTQVGTDGTHWSIGYPDGKVTVLKAKTVTLNVWFEGNNTTKPSATVKVKLTVA